MAAGATKMMAKGAKAMVMPRTPTPGATQPKTGPTVGRDPKTGKCRQHQAADRLGRGTFAVFLKCGAFCAVGNV